MANEKISELPSATTLDGTEALPIVQSGITSQTTAQDIANLVVSSYSVYTAILTQNGTNAPTAVILENTLGFVPVWSYVAQGSYECTYLDGFTVDKTIIFLGENNSAAVNTTYLIRTELAFPDSFSLITSDGEDSNIKDMPIEIRVYH